MEAWIEQIINHPVVSRVLPKLTGKEDYDRVLNAAKIYPNCNPEDTVLLLQVLRVCAEKAKLI